MKQQYNVYTYYKLCNEKRNEESTQQPKQRKITTSSKLLWSLQANIDKL